jgi:hypothetical protein
MIRLTFFIALIISTTIVVAQSTSVDLKTFRREQLQIQQKGMTVLAGWGVANMITGAYYSGNTSGSTKYFHQMNMYWGIVNGALAGATLLRMPAAKKKELNFAKTIKEQHGVEKIFLFNAGLDVAYITAGIALKEASKNNPNKRDRRFGYGNSLLMQGGFLLVFDGVMYAIMHKKGSILNKMLENVSITMTPTQIGLQVNL